MLDGFGGEVRSIGWDQDVLEQFVSLLSLLFSGCEQPVALDSRPSRVAERLGRPPLNEVREIVGEGNPAVLRLLPDRYCRRWEVGVMKSTDCNADMVWPQVRLPKQGRSACRAKMHPNLSSLLPVADIDVGRSFGANMFLLVEGNNAEHGTGSPLTLATMADAYSIGISGYFDTQGTATAMRGSNHSAPPYPGAARLRDGGSRDPPAAADRHPARSQLAPLRRFRLLLATAAAAIGTVGCCSHRDVAPRSTPTLRAPASPPPSRVSALRNTANASPGASR